MIDRPLHASPMGKRRCEPLTGRRRALCIGIDPYRRHPLAGAHADALAWAAALRQLGFARPVMILDHDATRQAILDALHTIVTDSQPGDAIVLQYAGHGTLVADLDGDELDDAISPRQDEAICPVDFDQGGLIVDDEIGRILALLPAGVSATCFFDCCHAGSMARDADPHCPMPRTLTLRPLEVERYHARVDRARAPSHARGVDGSPEVGFFACRSDEIAWETQGRGDFTRHALTVLRRLGDGVTNEGLLDAIVATFGLTARQTPTMVCAPALRGAQLFAATA